MRCRTSGLPNSSPRHETGSPELWVSRWRIVTSVGRPCLSRSWTGVSTYRLMGSSRATRPASTSCSTSMDVNSFDMDAARNTVSGVTTSFRARSAWPNDMLDCTPSRSKTVTAAPTTSARRRSSSISDSSVGDVRIEIPGEPIIVSLPPVKLCFGLRAVWSAAPNIACGAHCGFRSSWINVAHQVEVTIAVTLPASTVGFRQQPRVCCPTAGAIPAAM